MAIVRVLMVAVVFEAVVFVSLWLYARARRAEKLREDYMQKDRSQTLESFVKAGLAEYEIPLKRKLIWGVFVIPSVLIAVFIYATSSI